MRQTSKQQAVTSSTLEDKVKNYWRVSKSYNGRSKERISFIRASNLLSDIISSTAPTRRISRMAYALHYEIVQGAEPSENKQTQS